MNEEDLAVVIASCRQSQEACLSHDHDCVSFGDLRKSCADQSRVVVESISAGDDALVAASRRCAELCRICAAECALSTRACCRQCAESSLRCADDCTRVSLNA